MEKAGKSQGEGIQGQGQMALQEESEACWQSWWVGGDETGSGQGWPRCSKSELEVLILFGEKKSLILAAGSLECLKLQHSSWL